MNKRIFRLSFLATLFVLIISLGLVSVALFNYFEEQIFNELENEAGYISYIMENEEESFLESFSDNNKRITLVADDGRVLADTTANAQELDNHLNRKEIKAAIQNGKGKSSRYSHTLMEKTLYFAVRLDNGNVLRVSTTQNTVVVLLYGFLPTLIIIVIISLWVSVFVSNKISRAIIKPINELDLENPENNEAYEELTPLLSKIAVQNKTIDEQIKAAQQKQEEFRLITENMNEGFLIIDNQANVLTYNHSALKLLEIQEVTQDSVLAFNRSKGFRRVVEKVLSGERAESDITHNDRSYSLIANPVYEYEKIIGAVIVIIDVTEGAKREQLRREFTSNVSHELKTPLTSISGFAEMMKAGGTSEETVVDFSTSIYDEAQRLIGLVSDIIKISELDENSVQSEAENVDLYELSEEILNRLKPFAKKQNVTLNLKGKSTLLLGSKKIFDEIIYNLCDNAIKYNKENGSVDVIISEGEDKINVTVKDTGIGIPLSEQSRVFERFYRVDKSHSKLVGGTGLGLAIVKHGAAYCNAEIKLESVENNGTSITIIFDK